MNDQKKKKVIVLYGGRSVEHAVSLQSAKAVIASLNPSRYDVFLTYISQSGAWHFLGPAPETVNRLEQLVPETLPRHSVSQSMALFLEAVTSLEDCIAFPVLHGSYGEDGTIQGFFEMAGIPYVGNGVLASSTGMDKETMKNIFARHQIPQGQYLTVRRSQYEADTQSIVSLVEHTFSYPLYVKPSNGGSSVGVHKITGPEEFRSSVDDAFRYDQKLLFEEDLSGREMQIAVLGNTGSALHPPKCSLVGEYFQEHDFMDYKAKYVDGKLVQSIPAALRPETAEAMKKAALTAFEALECTGLLRVDFFVRDQERFYINEVNTLPGFTPFSMYPTLWQKSEDMSYSSLLDELLTLAEETYASKNSLTRRFSL